jgi:8-oxo-dGTP pyrophosphatase MutT (NUDIX family)
MSVSEARHAASLIVLRRDTEGPKILMARRSAGHRFMPNVLVFPGGAVDEADFHAVGATSLRAEVAARVQRSAAADLTHALAVAACRELAEEVGLSLGDPPYLHQLDYLCRAVTPQDSPIRFDARFFVAHAEVVDGIMTPSRELEEPAWYGIEAALVSGCARPTKAILLLLRSWVSAPPPPNAPVPVLYERAWTQE